MWGILCPFLFGMRIVQKIKGEITSYTTRAITIGKNHTFSQYRAVNDIALFRNQKYQNGKTDTQGNYRYWFDIIQPKVNDEVKNVDFDTGNVFLHSDAPNDAVAVFILNANFKQWMRDTGQGENINEAEEAGAAEGNVVWKKTENGYELMDLRNLCIVNQTAKTLKDTAVIERHNLTQSDLRKMKGVWKDDVINKVIEECGDKTFGALYNSPVKEEVSSKNYEIFERNGEVSTKELYEAQGVLESENGGSEDEFVLAKIVCAGIGSKEGKEYILFAEEIDEMPYREYHRGPYKGRWLREGLVELLFDIQIRINRVGNEIAQGLAFASKILFRSQDLKTFQSALTDMMNGDILKSADFQQVEVRMNGFDQLVNEWNRLLELANRVSSSFEIVS